MGNLGRSSVRHILAFLLLLYRCWGPPEIAGPHLDDGSRTLIRWESPLPVLARFRYHVEGDPGDNFVYPSGREFVVFHEAPLLGAEAGVPLAGRFEGWTRSGEWVESEEIILPERPLGEGGYLELVTIDVGWGDAHLLALPGGEKVLVDCGSSYHLDELKVFLDSRIGPGGRILALVLTHPHGDHTGGALGDPDIAGDGVLEAYAIGRLLLPEVDPGDYEEFAGIVHEAGARAVPVLCLAAGDDEKTRPDALGWDPLVRVSVKNPDRSREPADENDLSVVLKVSFGLIDFLLTGDAGRVVEERLLARSRGTSDLACEVLKLAHHGSSDSNTPFFLEAVSPRLALLSIDPAEVAWSLPDAEVLGSLEELGVDIARTDDVLGDGSGVGGHVSVLTDGTFFELQRIPSTE